MKVQEKCPDCGSDCILVDEEECMWYCGVCGFESYDYAIEYYKIDYGVVSFKNGIPVRC